MTQQLFVIIVSEFLRTPESLQRLHGPFAMSYSSSGAAQKSEDEQLTEWQTTLTLILANRTPRDTEAITALGDILMSHGWIEAAHIW